VLKGPPLAVVSDQYLADGTYGGNMQSRLNSRVLSVMFSFFLCVCGTAQLALHAQQNVGRLLGVVRDPSAAVVPGASVAIRSVLTGVATTARTNAEGAYAFPVLPIGEYVLTVRAPGFKTLERPAIRIVSSEAITVDVQLELGQPSQTVQVSGLTATVDTITTTSSTGLLGSQLSELPLINLGSDRTIVKFMFTFPGAAPLVSQSSRGLSAGYYANATLDGSPEGNESYTVDGVIGSTLPHQSIGDQMSPPPEMVQEMRLNSTSSAEYGWNNGVGITVVTKSGTNVLHGELYEYFRNNALDARNFFASTVSPQKQNEFGFTLGGPVVIPHVYNGKDKTFFFALWSGYIYRATPAGGLFTVPTAAMRQGDFSGLLGSQIGTDALGRPVYSGEIYDPATTRSDGFGGFIRDPFSYNGQLNVITPSRLSDVSKYFQQYFPLPTLPGTQLNWAGSNAPSPNDTYKGFIKIDHNFSGNSRLNFAWEDRSVVSIAGGQWGVSPIATSFNNTVAVQRVRLGYIATLGGNKVLDFRFGVNRQANTSGPTAAAANAATQAGLTGTFASSTPRVSIAQLGGFGQPIAGTANTYMLVIPADVDFNWAVTNHNLKLGAAYLHTAWAPVYCVNCTGQFSFNQRETGLPGVSATGIGYASYFLGEVDSGFVTTGLAPLYRAGTYGFYAQDTWRVTPKLTLNYGLRLDYFNNLRETHDMIGMFDATVSNPGAGGRLGAISFFGVGSGRNGRHAIGPGASFWGPKFGLAYVITPKTVFRAAYGLSSSALFSIVGSGSGLPKNGWTWSASPFSADLGVTPAFNWNQGVPASPPPLPDLDPAIANGSSPGIVHSYDAKPSRTQNINAGIERQLVWDIVLKADYVGTLAHGLPAAGIILPNQMDPTYLQLGSLLLQNINSVEAQTAGIPVPYPGFNSTVAQALRPYPQYSSISDVASRSGYSLYHSLQATVQKRFGQGLFFLASYTASKQLTNVIAFSSNGYGQNNGFAQSTQMLRNKWLGVNDIPQYLTLSYTYQLPFGPGKRFANTTSPILKQLVGGWQVAGIQTYAKGTPVVLSTNASLPGGFGSVWANRVVNAPIGTNSCSPTGANLSVSAFTDPAAYTFGNTAVLPNVRTCPLYNENFSIQKVVSLRERATVLLSGDFTNIFNRVQLNSLQTNIDVAGSFGRYTSAFDPRFIQIHAEVRF
jgi:hypothetical protein